MRKLFLFLLIFVFISGCSKQNEDQDIGPAANPSISATDGLKKIEKPLEESVKDPSENPTEGSSEESSEELSEESAEEPFPTETAQSGDSGSSSIAISNEKEQKILKSLLYETNNEFAGCIGDTKIHMKLSSQEGNIVGVYYYDKYKKDIQVKGNITLEIKEYPSIYLMEDTEQYGNFNGIIKTNDCIQGFWRDGDRVYPMYLLRVGSNAEVPEVPDNNTKSYEGHWYGKNPGYYLGTELDVKALFSDMIYFDLEAYNGGNTGSYAGIALLDQKSAAVMINYYYWDTDYDYQLFELIKQQNDLYLNCSDYSYSCGMGVSFDNQYSKEKTVVEEPTALDVGIVNSSEQGEKFFNLVRTYYTDFINYTSYVAYEEITLDGQKALAGESILRGLSGYCYYVMTEDNIYAAMIDTDDIKYFTNDWNYYDHMPQPMQDWADDTELPISYYNDNMVLPFDEDIPNQLLNQMEQLKLGQKINLPNGYSLLGFTEGDINNDKEKDIAVAIQQNPGNITGSRWIYLFTQNQGKYELQYVNSKILLGALEGGGWGDPYDSISIKDGELHVCDYGGSSDRWSHDYSFKWIKDKLILYFLGTNSMNTNTGEVSESVYNFLTGTLITKTYNEFDPNTEEQTTTESFTIDHQISFEEAEAWLEIELEIISK